MTESCSRCGGELLTVDVPIAGRASAHMKPEDALRCFDLAEMEANIPEDE